MRPHLFLSFLVILVFAGCEKKSGDAMVLAKEHIAASTASPNGESAPTPKESIANDAVNMAELGKNDITVDQYVMSKEVLGTSRDPRAAPKEQWLVKVRMVVGGRQFNVQTDPAQFDHLKEGDRVKVSYRIGKYTGTVWDSEIR